MSGSNELSPPWWMGIGQSPQNALAPQPTWADAMDANAQLIAQQRQRDITAGLIDPATGWPTRAGAVQSAMGTALGLGTSDLPGGIRAYHASPYSFDRFDASKIGTGEGNQAFGYGMYAAESPAVSGGGGQYDQQFTARGLGKYDLNQQELSILRGLREGKSDLDLLRDQAQMGSSFDEAQAAIDRVKAAKAHIYEVSIGADPQHFLDWDKPLSEQSQHVQGAVTGLEGMTPTIPGHVTGGQLVDNLQTYHGSPADAAQALRDNGVAGIRYLDAGSRASGEGSRNYVVFDPATIEILRKYGIAGLGLGLGAAATQGNGQ